MAIQEYVDCVSQVSSQSKEDLIEHFLNITKTEMCLSKKTTESFVFSGSRYIIEAPESKAPKKANYIKKMVKKQ